MRCLTYTIILTLLLSNLALAQQVTKGEYFFNNDPGYGNGISFDVTETNGEFTKVIDATVDNLPDGFNMFYVRVQQDDAWSTFDRRLFYKIDPEIIFTEDVSLKDMVFAEYFLDTDPGYGNGTEIPITATQDLANTFTIDVSNIDAGFHIIYVRVKSSDNQWSTFDRRLFYINTPEQISFSDSPIAKAEYFFNQDPGYGNGKPIALDASGKEISQAFTVDISDLESGFHAIYFRVQNENKEWSTFERALFYISDGAFVMPEASPIVAAEYFFNEFVAIGNGTEITLSTNDDGNFETSINTGDLTEGEHLLFIRTKNEANIWSLYDVVPFTIDNTLGVDKILAEDFLIYPNSVQNIINIKTGHTVLSYKIFDLQGKKVQENILKDNTIQVRNLVKGVYFLTLKTAKGTVVKKIMKE